MKIKSSIVIITILNANNYNKKTLFFNRLHFILEGNSNMS